MNKVELIAVTKAEVCPGDDSSIVMVNVQHITTVEDWGRLGTKLTLLNGEHIIVKEPSDEVLDQMDECYEETLPR